MTTTDKFVLSPRQRDILDSARSRGEVQVESLAEEFTVTPQTIRRDLTSLCDLRLLQRVHGGAVIADGVQNLGYSARQRLAAQEKAAIGQRVAQLIPNDSSVCINIGTTTEQVAVHLRQRIGLLVITNNLNVVNTLRDNEKITVMTAGGVVRPEDGGIVGDSTVDFVAQFKFDYAVIGASAIEADGTVLDFDIREVRVAQAIIRNARSIILVADSTKFERNAPVRIVDVCDVDYFVTGNRPPESFLQLCDEHDVSVEIALQHDEDVELSSGVVR